MPRWFKVCRTEDLKAGQGRSLSLFARPYAVFNVGGELYGLDAACGHMKANLAAGHLYGEIIECSMHGWEYNVKTGACLTLDHAPLRTHPVKLEAGFIWIGLDLAADGSDPDRDV
jgi:nitrite reductase/ring-hydroxylating ferredoxin subunit